MQKPAASTSAIPTLLQLIDQEQLDAGWTDEDLEQHLGVQGMGLMALVRKGVVQFTYRVAVDVEQKMQANILQVLQTLICSHMTDAAECIPEIHARLSIGPDDSRMVAAYREAESGETRLLSLNLPHAMVWVAPHSGIKPMDV